MSIYKTWSTRLKQNVNTAVSATQSIHEVCDYDELQKQTSVRHPVKLTTATFHTV